MIHFKHKLCCKIKYSKIILFKYNELNNMIISHYNKYNNYIKAYIWASI